MNTAKLIRLTERKLERQKDAVTDTEHLIRVLRRQLQEEPAKASVAEEEAVF